MRQHEALTLTYAGVSPFKELQFAAANYRHVLNSEGLTAFANGSYSWSRPGTQPLEDLEFRTRSSYVEGGLHYPVIRAREAQPDSPALGFMSENYSFMELTPEDPQAVDRLRGARVRADGDFADRLGGINQFSATFSQGIDGLGTTDNDNPLASRLGGRVDFSKIEAFVSRLQPLGDRFSAVHCRLRPICLHPAAGARAMRVWRAGVRPRLRSLRTAGRSLLDGHRRAALRPAEPGDPAAARSCHGDINDQGSGDGQGSVNGSADRAALRLHGSGKSL